MSVPRGRAFLLVACGVVSAATSAETQGFAYAPGEYRYRITSAITRTQRVGEQRTTDSAVSLQVISLSLAPQGKDTLRFVYSVDSVWATLPVADRVLSRMRGKQVTGLMSPRGEVFSFRVPVDSTSPMRGQEYESLRSFLIRFPNASPRAGLSWSDSVSTAFRTAGIDGTELTILTSRFLGDTVIAGERAWRVERTATATLSGSGAQGGESLILEGDRSVVGESYFSRSGVYLGSVSTQAGETWLGTRGSGRVLVVNQSSTTKIERLTPG